MDIDHFIKLLNLKLYLGKPGDTQGKKKKKTLVCVIAGFPQPQEFAPKLPIRPR